MVIYIKQLRQACNNAVKIKTDSKKARNKPRYSYRYFHTL